LNALGPPPPFHFGNNPQVKNYKLLIFRRIFSGKPNPCQGLDLCKKRKKDKKKLKTPVARQDIEKSRLAT